MTDTSHSGDSDIPQPVRLIHDIKTAFKSPIFISTQNFSYSSALPGIQAEPPPMSWVFFKMYLNMYSANLVSLIYSRKLAGFYAINALFSTIMNSSLQIKR